MREGSAAGMSFKQADSTRTRVDTFFPSSHIGPGAHFIIVPAGCAASHQAVKIVKRSGEQIGQVATLPWRGFGGGDGEVQD